MFISVLCVQVHRKGVHRSKPRRQDRLGLDCVRWPVPTAVSSNNSRSVCTLCMYTRVYIIRVLCTRSTNKEDRHGLSSPMAESKYDEFDSQLDERVVDGGGVPVMVLASLDCAASPHNNSTASATTSEDGDGGFTFEDDDSEDSEDVPEVPPADTTGRERVRACSWCDKSVAMRHQCSRCRNACYCNEECQKLGWFSVHRYQCRPAAEAPPPPVRRRLFGSLCCGAVATGSDDDGCRAGLSSS